MMSHISPRQSTLIIFLLLASFYGSTCLRSHIDKQKIERKAETYATAMFGDKKEPLTSEERKEWYKYMDVKKEPKLEDLTWFIKEYEINYE